MLRNSWISPSAFPMNPSDQELDSHPSLLIVSIRDTKCNHQFFDSFPSCHLNSCSGRPIYSLSITLQAEPSVCLMDGSDIRQGSFSHAFMAKFGNLLKNTWIQSLRPGIIRSLKTEYEKQLRSTIPYSSGAHYSTAHKEPQSQLPSTKEPNLIPLLACSLHQPQAPKKSWIYPLLFPQSGLGCFRLILH